MITQWKPVSWVPNEDITSDKLNTMADNLEYLRQKQVGARYSAFGVNTEDNLKIISGVSYVPGNAKGPTCTINVSFGNAFSNGCKPVVTTSCYSEVRRYMMITVQALTGTARMPDNTGFRATAAYWATKDPHCPPCYVAWQALGY